MSMSRTRSTNASQPTARREAAALGRRGLCRSTVLVVAVALLPALLVGAVTASAGSPVFPNDLYRDRHVMDRLAAAKIDRRYACSVVTPRRKGRPRLLLVHVNGKAAAKRVRSFRSKLRRPRHARVRLTSKRFRQRVMQRIFHSVKGRQPHTTEATGLGFESPLARRRCPRVEIILLPEGEASAEQEHWARQMRRRYGRDRVVVRRSEMTLR